MPRPVISSHIMDALRHPSLLAERGWQMISAHPVLSMAIGLVGLEALRSVFGA